MPKASLLAAVDLPGARSWKSTGGKFPDSHKALHRAASELEKQGQNTVVIIGDSHSEEIRDKVARHAPFDAVFIDGDHSFDGVRADWRDYGPMGSMLVAFHDIRSKQDNVESLFNELKRQYNHEELAYYEKGGIGIIWK